MTPTLEITPYSKKKMKYNKRNKLFAITDDRLINTSNPTQISSKI